MSFCLSAAKVYDIDSGILNPLNEGQGGEYCAYKGYLTKLFEKYYAQCNKSSHN
jgi:hypothetical protein